MAREKEIKINLNIPLEEFILRIENDGFVKESSIDQLDIYFDKEDWYLYEHLAALRLRSVNKADHSFTFKKMFYVPGEMDKYHIEEIEVPAPFTNIENLRHIFELLALPIERLSFNRGDAIEEYLLKHKYIGKQRMNKVRQTFVKGNNEIVIDNVDQVGVVIEIECVQDEPLDIVQEILSTSEWSRSLEGTSYIWLRNVMGLDSHIENLKRFSHESDWNVWEHEVDWYKALATGN